MTRFWKIFRPGKISGSDFLVARIFFQKWIRFCKFSEILVTRFWKKNVYRFCKLKFYDDRIRIFWKKSMIFAHIFTKKTLEIAGKSGFWRCAGAGYLRQEWILLERWVLAIGTFNAITRINTKPLLNRRRAKIVLEILGLGTSHFGAAAPFLGPVNLEAQEFCY